MSSALTYAEWLKFVAQATDKDNYNDPQFFIRFSRHLDHVVAIENLIPLINLEKYKKCLQSTKQLLATKLLHQMQWNDEANTDTLVAVMGLFKSFANIIILNSSYQIVPSVLPIAKCKWYDLSVFFTLGETSPDDGDQPDIDGPSWKDLMKHACADRPSLMSAAIDLLSRKLHMLAITYNAYEYQDVASIILKNGRKTVQELVTIIKKLEQISDNLAIDEILITVMMPFMSRPDMEVLCEIIIDRAFKNVTNHSKADDSNPTDNPAKIAHLLQHKIFQDNVELQTCLVTSLINHLTSNIIRVKRRRSDNPSPVEDESISIKNIISAIENEFFQDDDDYDANESIERCWIGLQKAANGTSDSISPNRLQKFYVSQWLLILEDYLGVVMSTLEIKNRLRIFLATSIILFATSALLSKPVVDSMLKQLNSLVASIETQGDVKTFFTHIPFDKYLMKLIEKLEHNTTTFDGLDTCDKYEEFLSTLLALFMRHTFKCIIKDPSQEVRFSNYLKFVNRGGISTMSAQIVTQITTMKQALIIETLSRVTLANRAKSCGLAARSIAVTPTPGTPVSALPLPPPNQTSLLKKVKPCVKRIKRFVEENKSLIGQETTPNHLEKNLLVLSIISMFKSYVIQRDEESLKSDQEMFKALFKAIVRDISKFIDATSSKKSTIVNEYDYFFCTDQCTDLVRFYYKHSAFIQRSLKLDLNYGLACSLLRIDFDSSDEETYVSAIGSRFQDIFRVPAAPAVDQPEDKGESVEAMAYKLIAKQAKMAKKNKDKVCYTIISRHNAISASIKLVKNQALQSTSRNTCGSRQRELIFDIATHLVSSLSKDDYSVVFDRVCHDLSSCNVGHHNNLVRLIELTEVLFTVTPTGANAAKFALLESKSQLIAQSLIVLTNLCQSHRPLSPKSSTQLAFLGNHTDNNSVHCCIVTHTLQTMSVMLKKISPPNKEKIIHLVMSAIVNSNLSSHAAHIKHPEQYLSLAQAIYRCLSECLLHRPKSENLMPLFVRLFGELIRCVVLSSGQEKLELVLVGSEDYQESSGDVLDSTDQKFVKDEDTFKKFESLAMNVSRIMTQLSKFGKEFVPHAPFLIANYVESIQIVTCHTRIRWHLNEGMYRIFNLIDAHQQDYQKEQQEIKHQRKTQASARGSLFEMIFARMDQSSREILRIMHDTYDKFYRYKSKY